MDETTVDIELAGESAEAEKEMTIDQAFEKVYSDFNNALASREEEQKQKEQDLTQAIMMINQAISAVNSKIDSVIDHLSENGLDKEKFEETVKTKMVEATEHQKKVYDAFIEKQKELLNATKVSAENVEAPQG